MSKKFNHELFEQIELKENYIDGKRHYLTPSGKSYPSVTTVIGNSLDKKGLNEWRAKVGNEEADKITRAAASRGTKVHKLCEDYVLNKDDFLKGAMPSSVSLFKQIQPYLDNYLTKVYGIEIPLYSDFLQTAGRCDLVCRMHDCYAIVDYKTSSKPKKEEWIEGYFLQLTAYAMMVEEMYKIHIPYIIVLVAVEDDNLQYFVKNPNQYKDRVTEIFRNYSKKLI
jgi:CRISPR/Cas system-associated exonuclease Cas4 (RecB family)